MAPRLIRKVSNADGIVLWEDTSAVTQVIDPQTAHTMMTLFKAVTAARHRRGRGSAQPPARGKDRHHLRLY